MSFWTADSLRSAAGGAWIARAARGMEHREIEGVSIDTRTIRPGEAFVALAGDRFDGHDFVRAACDAGAAMIFVERESAARGLAPGPSVVKVPDARRALMRMAKAWRRSLEGTKVVAVTGSVGKTTTIRLIDGALSTRLRVTSSQKSFNNNIGAPLTVLRAKRGDQALVCEVGMNSPGEIAALGEVLEPDVAVITALGRAHVGGLGSVEAIAREKGTLLTFLRPGGLAVAPAGQPLLEDYLRTAPNLVTFGVGSDADLRVSAVECVAGEGGARTKFVVNDRSAYEIPLLGEHNALNAAAAIAVARRLGLPEEAVREGLAAARGAEMRLQVREVGGVRVFNDAYNASPESMIAAVRTFSAAAADATRRVAILGDMLELGDFAPGAHAEVADAIVAAGNIDVVIAVGPLSLHLADRLLATWPERRVVMVGDVEGVTAGHVAGLLRPRDAALLKGSRRMGLERVEAALAARAPSGAPAVAGHAGLRDG